MYAWLLLPQPQILGVRRLIYLMYLPSGLETAGVDGVWSDADSLSGTSASYNTNGIQLHLPK